jgi:uncharacterized protein YegL
MSKELQKSSKIEITTTGKKKLDLSKINVEALSASLSEMSIPRLFYQLVVFVLDASQSMTWEGISGKTKGDEIHDQIIPIIERLQQSKNSNSFDLSMYAFSQSHEEFIPLSTLKNLNIEGVSFNPCDYVGNFQTYAEPVFLEVEEKIERYLMNHKDKNSQAMIIFLGDGDIYDYSKVFDICNRLKNNSKVTILSYLLEDKNWKEKLSLDDLDKLKVNIKNISSKDVNGVNFFESKVDPEEIRKHMIKSISTVSKID